MSIAHRAEPTGSWASGRDTHYGLLLDRVTESLKEQKPRLWNWEAFDHKVQSETQTKHQQLNDNTSDLQRSNMSLSQLLWILKYFCSNISYKEPYLTMNSWCTFRTGVSLNIHSFILSLLVLNCCHSVNKIEEYSWCLQSWAPSLIRWI